MKKILGVGNALVDVLIRLEGDGMLSELRLPKGSMQLVSEERFRALTAELAHLPHEQHTGGSAGNTMLALARLGARPGFVGKIGRDDFGRFYHDHAAESGITPCLTVCSEHTGVATTFISPDGERTFATYLGAAALLHPEDVQEVDLSGCDVLYVEGYLVQSHELMQALLGKAKESGVTVCMDLASYNVVQADLDFFRALVRDYVDIVFANEEECAAFTGGLPTEEGLRQLASLCRVAVVKLGARGAIAAAGESVASAPAIAVPQVTDTTAAGDFFAGGFLYAYTHGAPLDVCLRAGALLGGEVIQVVGTTLPAGRWNEIRLKIDSMLAR